MEFLPAIASIILVNILLSGDNAVIIALASRNLPKEQRTKVMIWGCLGAVVLRIILTFIAAFLLQIPFVQFCGGIALAFIAVKLLDDSKPNIACKEAGSFWQAIKIILVADVIMSLDNVLAIAGVAGGNWLLLIFGLVISIPIVIGGSQILLTTMDRLPWLIYLGSAILGWTAAKMMVGDLILGRYLAPFDTAIGVAVTLLVIGLGFLIRHKKSFGYKQQPTKHNINA